jgi:hypothetical protein
VDHDQVLENLSDACGTSCFMKQNEDVWVPYTHIFLKVELLGDSQGAGHFMSIDDSNH